MRNASRTWALVVGIDEYDDPTIPRLTGAAADALAAVSWLRRLGVPDEQILLHADPTEATRPAVEACGLPFRRGTFTEISDSLLELRRKAGARLFVFLSGHGLFEPSAQRVFITRDATQDLTRNLGLDWLTALLRGMQFETSFIIMDGCLNQPYSASIRSKFEAGVIPSLKLDPPRPESTVVACYAASQGERALEVGGKGLFMQPLLEALDMARPSPFVTLIDDASGTVRVDLRRAVLEVVGPTVTRRAADSSHTQNPTISVVGRGENWRDITVVEIPPPATVQIRVLVDPTEASQDVRLIRLWAEDTAWQRLVPSPPDVAVQVPVVSVVPAGTALTIQCRLQPGTSYPAPGIIGVPATGDQDVVFELPRPQLLKAGAGEAVGAVTTVTHDGRLAFEARGPTYDEVQAVAHRHPFDVSIEPHESGPVIHVPEDHARDLPTVLREVADAVNRTTPPDIAVLTVQPSVPEAPTRLRLSIDREALLVLAHALGDAPIVTLNEGRSMTAFDLLASDVVEVPAGPVRVSLNLPWGTTTTAATAADGGTAEVVLDADVGLSPLLVQWLTTWPDRPVPSGPGVVPWDAATVVHRLDPRDRSSSRLQPRPDGVLSPVAPVHPWTDVAVVEHDGRHVGFVLHPSLAVAWSADPVPRAEPLPHMPSWEWHTLVSSGRLEVLSPRQAAALAEAKWDEPVLGVAGAYVCYAQRQDEYLRTVLDNLAGLGPMPADVAVLRAALDRRTGVTSAATAESLERVVAEHQVPVLRWGVPIGILAGEHYGVEGLVERLRDVERRCLSQSIWTSWRADPPQ